MIIRVALDIEIPKLITLGSELYYPEIERWSTMSLDVDKLMRLGAQAIQDPNQQVFIATDDAGEILGFHWVCVTELAWSSDTIGTDILLYVHPEHRNLSVAKGLIDAFEKWAKVCGAKLIHTGASSGISEDKAALTMYQHLGYDVGGYNFYKEL